MRLIDYFKFKLKKKISEEEVKENNICKIHKDDKREFKGFCSNCKQNLCESCLTINSNCPKNNNNNHSIIKFDSLKNEIKSIMKKLNDYFTKENFDEENIKKTIKNFFGSSISQKSEENKSNIKSEIVDIKTVKGDGNNVLIEKGEKKIDLDLMLIISIVLNDEKKFPNYKHYENIKNLYHIICDKLIIKYYSYNNDKTNIRLFGERFIKKNENKCSVLIENKIYKLSEVEFYDIKDKEEKLEVILYKEDDIIDMSYMFCDCEILRKIRNKSKWTTNDLTNMSYMFYNCKSLKSLPLFLEWETSKVTNMSYMFYGCESLLKLPNISQWKTDNVKNMSHMFYECISIENLNGISNWDTSQVQNMSYMFYECKNLIEISNIFQWKLGNVTNMSFMFYNCLSLSKITDDKKNEGNKIIEEKKKNASKVINMSNMFNGCESLETLPTDISNWDVSQVQYMSYMFSNCNKLKELPDISEWEPINVLNMNNMFENCISLKKLPNIFKWKIDKLVNISNMIEGCNALENVEDFSKWNKEQIVFKEGEKFGKIFDNEKDENEINENKINE